MCCGGPGTPIPAPASEPWMSTEGADGPWQGAYYSGLSVADPDQTRLYKSDSLWTHRQHGRAGHFGDSLFYSLQGALNQPDGGDNVGKILKTQITSQSFAIGFRGALQVIAFLRHFGQLFCISGESVASQSIPVGELQHFPFSRRIAVFFRLAERIGSPVEILKAIYERAGQ